MLLHHQNSQRLTVRFIDVGVDISTIYTIVKRNVNGTYQYFVEAFDNDLLTDSAKTGGAAASVSMSHVATETVNVILDGSVQADRNSTRWRHSYVSTFICYKL